jgi:hypothetical protein
MTPTIQASVGSPVVRSAQFKAATAQISATQSSWPRTSQATISKIAPALECSCYSRRAHTSGCSHPVIAWSAMFDEEPDQIIHKSQRALAEWTWLSTICDRPDQLVDVLNREARLLASVAYEHPKKAKSILDLIDGYKDLVSQVESRLQDQKTRRVVKAV